MWGPTGAVPRTMRLPASVDTPERVADGLIESIQADRFLASPLTDIAERIAAWAHGTEAALPALASPTFDR
jgi:hypothetical protein